MRESTKESRRFRLSSVRTALATLALLSQQANCAPSAKPAGEKLPPSCATTLRPLWKPGRVGDQLEGAQPLSMLIDVGDDDELVGLGFRDQRGNPGRRAHR